MIRSTDRILATHAGRLPRSAELTRLVLAHAAGESHDADLLARTLKSEVAAIVARQVACGIDCVNDGEASKTNFNNYVRERLSGLEERPYVEGKSPKHLTIVARDARRFPEYFELGLSGFARVAPARTQIFCTGPLAYVWQAALAEHLAHFRAALAG